jgi:hypothetical protein
VTYQDGTNACHAPVGGSTEVRDEVVYYPPFRNPTPARARHRRPKKPSRKSKYTAPSGSNND